MNLPAANESRKTLWLVMGGLLLALTLVATPGAATRTRTPSGGSGRRAVVSRGWRSVGHRDTRSEDSGSGDRCVVIDSLPLLNGEPSTDAVDAVPARRRYTFVPLEVWKANILLALDIAKKRQAGATDVVNPTVSNHQRARPVTMKFSSSQPVDRSPRPLSPHSRSRCSGC
jgi:hypothetical protein